MTGVLDVCLSKIMQLDYEKHQDEDKDRKRYEVTKKLLKKRGIPT